MVPKVHLANYNEFYEKRWFASGADFDTVQMANGVPMGSQLFDLGSGVLLGVELCEDLWVPQPPSGALALQGANLIANLSASDEYVSKAAYRRDLVAGQSARCVAGYVYAGAGVHESTTDLVFSGATLVAENGGILAEGERFVRESVLTVADVDVAGSGRPAPRTVQGDLPATGQRLGRAAGACRLQGLCAGDQRRSGLHLGAAGGCARHGAAG